MWFVTVYTPKEHSLETHFNEDRVYTFDGDFKLDGVHKTSWSDLFDQKGTAAIVVMLEDLVRFNIQVHARTPWMHRVILLYVDNVLENPHTVSSKTVFKNHPEKTLYFDNPFSCAYEYTMEDDSQNEIGFLSLCNKILNEGRETPDRTGVGIISLFSPQIVSYDLSDGKVPCFTTKKVAWKNTIKELLWFISGSTDSTELEREGINWWVGNTSRVFLDRRGLTDYEVGELGPMYGWHWRRQGARYIPQKDRAQYDEHGTGGFDQLQRLIDNIKAVKNGDHTSSRRLLMTTYIPNELDRAVLEPCHTLIQFDVDGEYLECVLYQRSGDMFLGVQINILSYSILTHLIANVCGLKARRFHHHLGNAHIYKNHIFQMCRQLIRTPSDPPTLTINHHDNIDDYTIDDFELHDYNPQSYIRAPMAI